MNKCIKIILNKCKNIDIKITRDIIKDMSFEACRASNKAMRMWFEYEELMNVKKMEDDTFDVKSYSKNRYGKEYKNVIEGYMKELMPMSNTSNVTTLHQQVVQNTFKRLKDNILNYEVQLPSFKNDMPYFFKNDAYTINKDIGGKFEIGLSFFSLVGLGEYGFKKGDKIITVADKLNKSEKSTLEKIIKGNELVKEIKRLESKSKSKNITKENADKLICQAKLIKQEYNSAIDRGDVYKQGSAQILINKKGKIEFIISYTYEKKKVTLDYNKVLGIDLGVTKVATMGIYNSTTDEYEYVNYRYNQINGDELIAFRQKLYNLGMSNTDIEKELHRKNLQLHQAQLKKCKVGSIDGLELKRFRETTEENKRQLAIASKFCGQGRCGHGYNTRMKVVNKVRNKVSNFADTFNHKYSKYIVDFAVKNGCGVIQMEDLSGITSKTKESFLKNWSYYDLQQKIIYKAREKGIKAGVYKNNKNKVTETYMVNPRYTSKRCSNCGNIHKDNRDCKKDQAKFECKICGHSENADINASKNIAIPHIDTIISEYIKENKKEIA
ncbi:MAG: RNA-guided endonuclease TnpB family protein [Clostridium sp.]|uniref:RNA-guided endonuclease TnpB family protein n=1 Tax=Clostridium sp. TaxID=1506 RepID=UPI003F3F6437